MKLTKFRISVAAALAAVLLLGLLGYAVDPGNLLGRVSHKLAREGVAGVWDAILERFEAPETYSVSDKSSHPPLESAEARNALPEFKVIAGVDVATLSPSRESGKRYDTWHRSHGDDFSSKYSSLEQINKDNVRQLEVAWTYSSGADLGDPAKNGMTVETNPITVNGRLFVTSVDGHVISIDAGSGRELWRLKLQLPVARRGMVWEPNADFSRSRLFVPAGDGVYAVNAASGEILREFGNKGQVGSQLSLVAPAIVNDKLIVALVTPAVEAYDLRSGRLLWSRSLLDKSESKRSRIYGGAPWGGMSADPARGLVYMSTGNPRPELVGVLRPGDNRYTCSVVAIRADTGEVAWAFQEVSRDLWDLDVPSPPVLTTTTRGGKRIDVVATVTKLGHVLLLDRDFGKPVFDYRMRRAPVSTVPGEKTSPYQPAIELPEPFSKPVFEASDVTDLSESAHSAVLQKIRGATFGYFPPPVIGGKVVLYGLHGGGEWPGAAVDPRNGILYVPSNQVPWIIRTDYLDLKDRTKAGEGIPGDAFYQANCAACHKADRSGSFENEFSGGAYNPALTGITLLRDRKTLTSTGLFAENHQLVKLDRQPAPAELETLFDYFSRLDKTADQEKAFTVRAFYQMLLDDQGFPASKPPWGFLSAIDLNTGRKLWQVPFGEYENLQRNGASVKGQVNFGGAIATASGLLFATGTVDSKLRAYDAVNGRELWSFKLPAAGSAPPVTYQHEGRQDVVVVASGGTFHGFTGRSDKVIAFRLPKARR